MAEYITRKERGRAASTLHTHHEASLMVSCHTTVVPPLRLRIGPAREASLSTGPWRGHVPPRKKERKKVRKKETDRQKGRKTERENLPSFWGVLTGLVEFQPMQLTLWPLVVEHWYDQRQLKFGPTSVTTNSVLLCSLVAFFSLAAATVTDSSTSTRNHSSHWMTPLDVNHVIKAVVLICTSAL